MNAHIDSLQAEPGYGGNGRNKAASPRPTGLVALFGSLPFRQLAGPAAVFLFWPPTHARTPFPLRPRPALPGDPAASSKDNAREDLMARAQPRSA
jgi:hypothetical protein